MVIKIHKDTQPEALKEMLKKVQSKRSLRPFVGKLKRGLDGMTYQNEARNEWS
ncbi:hypothetical protein GCM10028807_42400 [Spirosoma daeguense]